MPAKSRKQQQTACSELSHRTGSHHQSRERRGDGARPFGTASKRELEKFCFHRVKDDGGRRKG